MKHVFFAFILFLFASCNENKNALEYSDDLVGLQENLINKLEKVSSYQEGLEGKNPSKENYNEMMQKVKSYMKVADSCNIIVKNDDRFSETAFHNSALQLFNEYSLMGKSLEEFYVNSQFFLQKDVLTEDEKNKLLLESNKLQNAVNVLDRREKVFIKEQEKFAKEHKFQLE